MILFQKPIPVLMYHRIHEPDPSSSLVVSPESFKRQIDWLERKGFDFLSLDAVLDHQGKMPLKARSVALTFDDGFRDSYERGLSLLVAKQKKGALFVVVNWVGQDGFLNWREIRGLANSGITIGSHSLTHRWLPDIEEREELRREIFDSKRRIEDEIGFEVRHFCYPVGGVTERVAELVKVAGYRAGWVSGARPTVPIRERLFSLRRIKVGPSDASLFRFAVKGYGLKSLFW